jgi:opacity protein-like surface antigen
MRSFILGSVMLVTLSAAAQTPGSPVSFGIQGNVISSDINAFLRDIAGLPAPSGTYEVALEEVYGLGLGGGVHLDVNLGLLSFRVYGDYITLSPDKDKFASAVQKYFPGASIQFVEGGRIEIYSGSANLKFVILPIPVVKPYLTAGGGLAHVKTTPAILAFNGAALPEFEILKAQTVGTINGGAGVDFVLGGLALFGELKLNWLFIEEGTSTYIPVATVGLTF